MEGACYTPTDQGDHEECGEGGGEIWWLESGGEMVVGGVGGGCYMRRRREIISLGFLVLCEMMEMKP